MTTSFKFIFSVFILVFLLGCESDENIEILNQRKTEIYDLGSVSDPAISGFAIFTENTNGTVTISLELDNTFETDMHPAHLHFNTAAQTGGIALTLGTINGLSGKSSITVNALDDGTPINYNTLINFDGYINVHKSETDLSTLVAQGDIGQNDLTGESKTYAINQVNDSGIIGNANFFERNNGEALAVLELTGTTTTTNYPASLRMNDVATTGTVVFNFNTVNGDTGISNTNLANLDGSTDFFGYEDILNYDGHININEALPSVNILANANIGSNENVFVPQTITYNVTNINDTAYIFNGGGFIDAENPNLTFTKGNTYIFNLDVAGQAFYIKTTQDIGTLNIYNDGVTGNGSDLGTLEFVVLESAPSNLFYNSEINMDMTGAISITD